MPISNNRSPNAMTFLIALLAITCQPAFESNQALAWQLPTVEAPAQNDLENAVAYELDNSHTSLVFAVSHFGLSYTYGRFNQCSGNFALNGGELTSEGFSFSIKSESIDTNNAERDKHLRGPDFFDTAQFPEIKFVTTGVTKQPDGSYNVDGDFTMRGQTRSITMPVRVVGVGRGPFGKQRAGYFTKFTIKRSDFGMDKMAGQVGDKIAITFSFEGIKKQ